MASFVTPKKNTAYTFYASLTSQANPLVFQANPTLATGDVKTATDNNNPGNISSLPTVINSGKTLKVDLTSGEMNGDNVTVIFSDAAGAEWCDLVINIQTTAQQIDNLLGDTIALAEPTGAPAASATAASKLGRLYQVLRNKLTITATAKTLTDDSGAALWSKTLSDDGTTYTENEGS